MSFLGGRVAVAENKYFKEESEAKAVELRNRKLLEQALHPGTSQGSRAAAAAAAAQAGVGSADVLPEVLMHSLPLSLRESSASSLSQEVPTGFSAVEAGPRAREEAASALRQQGQLSHRGIVQVPQLRLGPAKYQLSFPPPGSSTTVSTANERRVVAAAGAEARRLHAQQAAAMREGMVMVSKAFGVATLIVYGGAALGVGLGLRAMGVSKLEDIPEKGRAVMEPRVAAIRALFEPIKDKMNSFAARLRMTEEERKAVGQKYAEVLRGPEKN